MRWPITAALGIVSLTVLGGAARPARVARTVSVSVTCPGSQDQENAVQPWEAQLQRGDSIEWNLVEPVLSDTIMISLKQPSQRWPFASAANPSGRRSARGGRALYAGRYPYKITLRCPVPGGPPALVVIDPDIIINE